MSASQESGGRAAHAVEALVLHDDRYFDPELGVRSVARTIYEETRGLPLICPHGHVEPGLLAANEPFPEPTSLVILRDHYIYRMLFSQGISMESMGIPSLDGAPVEADPRRVWQRFADHYHLFRGTPTGAWLDHELSAVFGVKKRLNGRTAQQTYDEIAEKLALPEFRPRALFERFGIEVLATTDSASDPLAHHRAIRDSGWRGGVIPTFRPDAVFRIAAPAWRDELQKLASVSGRDIGTFAAFIQALEERRTFFGTMGATATDHGVLEPATAWLSRADAEALFSLATRGLASPADQARFEAHMLMEMARMSVEDGLVMQLHPGALRDHNPAVRARFGPDAGADIPIATEYTHNLRPLLNEFGSDPRLTLVVFTLDESTYARELAPLAGHYPAMRLGPPWWFHDSIEGMNRFRRWTTESAGIHNTAGFNDDTRAFCSIPARHDLSRRVDANYLAGLVARHVIGIDDARQMARALAYDLAKATYKLGDAPGRAAAASA